MTQNLTNAPGCALDFFIFGATGDLAINKLLPALYMAYLHGELPQNTRIIGIGRQDFSIDEYLNFVEFNISSEVSQVDFKANTWHEFICNIQYLGLDILNVKDFSCMLNITRQGAERVFYLATSSLVFTTICEKLALGELIDKKSKIVLEKPLGHDSASAVEISDAVGRYFNEHQIYRIDHYLGKETVQNLMVLRFGNSILEPIWRAPSISSVQITVAESVGVGNRAGFYDTTGAMRDMVQNHLLQLLCIIAMEPPVSLDADAVRDEKLKVLRSLRRMSISNIAQNTVRGQYSSGTIGKKYVKGYCEEEGVPSGSKNETFVALKAFVDTWRWANVPFFLRTGKRMPKRSSRIVIEFANPPVPIFPYISEGCTNKLVIDLQPQEAICLQIMAKLPGSGMSTKPVFLNLDLHSAFSQRRPEAYERLIIDIIRGRLTHFMRRDELLAAWHWIEPIIEGWKSLQQCPEPYEAGTWGPPSATSLMTSSNLHWND